MDAWPVFEKEGEHNVEDFGIATEDLNSFKVWLLERHETQEEAQNRVIFIVNNNQDVLRDLFRFIQLDPISFSKFLPQGMGKQQPWFVNQLLLTY